MLNKKLLESGVGNLSSEYILKAHQYYTFDLLTPIKYFNWFGLLEKGAIEIDSEFLNL